MKQYRHKQTNDIVSEVENKSGYYKNINIPDGQLICGKYIIGCDDWEEIESFPIGTKVSCNQFGTIYTKISNTEWEFNEVNRCSIDTNRIGKDLRLVNPNKEQMDALVSNLCSKPEYTILSLKDNKKQGIFYNLLPNGNYSSYSNNPHGFTLKECFNYGNTIHSVRRESDGEVFTIEDDVINTNNVTNKIGKIESFHILSNGIWFKTSNYDVPMCYIQSKVKPKEWEITAFRSLHSLGDRPLQIITSETIKESFKAINQSFTLKHYLDRKDAWEIYSVRRLSDNVEFKFDDIVQSHFGKGRIISFTPEAFGRDYVINCKHLDNNSFFNCEDNVKLVEKLFTTEDGVDIYPEDNVICVKKLELYISNNEHKVNTFCKYNYKEDTFIYFSTEEAAQAYIDKNKPKKALFITEDGVEVFDENQKLFSVCTKSAWETHCSITTKIIKSNVSRTGWQNLVWKHFSTDEARTAYIINNKPLLSLNDVRNNEWFRARGSASLIEATLVQLIKTRI